MFKKDLISELENYSKIFNDTVLKLQKQYSQRIRSVEDLSSKFQIEILKVKGMGQKISSELIKAFENAECDFKKQEEKVGKIDC